MVTATTTHMVSRDWIRHQCYYQAVHPLTLEVLLCGSTVTFKETGFDLPVEVEEAEEGHGHDDEEEEEEDEE